MSGKVISLEIGLTTTNICEVDYKKKNPRVYNCVSFDTPKNSFDDGYIRDKNTFSLIAREYLTKYKIKGDKVVFTISSTKIVNREVIIPFVKENRIQDVINANASEYFPVDITDYILTYTILETIQEGETKKLRILVFAAPDNLIKNYYNIAELLGLEVMAIDYSGNSVYQIIKSQVNKGNNLVIQFNEQSTLLNIMENGVLKLQRTVGFSSLSIIHSLMEADYLNISDEANGLKQLVHEKFIMSGENLAMEEAAVSLSYSEDSEFQQHKKNYELKKEIMNSLQYLTGNIQRVMDYYYSKNKDKRIASIYITGFGSKYNGLDELLHLETGLDVETIRVLQAVSFRKNIQLDDQSQSDYIACIGATIDPLNFVSKEYQLKEKKSNSIHIIRMAIGAVLVISVALVGTSLLDYKNASIDNDRLNAEIASLSEINEVYEAHNNAKVLFDQVNEMNLLTKSSGTILGKLILELEDKLPRQSIIESFQITEDGITLSMKCNTKEGAAKTLMQLKEIPYLSNVATTGINQEADENGLSTTRFIVTGSYNLLSIMED
ncbi:MAG: type pilus assembly protein PilM [Anaerocolumna sp.]|jgi:type IV pilus assembly protein PilM|nr:type pilus assembly protein PilM [Anaerocolumna sp.]